MSNKQPITPKSSYSNKPRDKDKEKDKDRDRDRDNTNPDLSTSFYLVQQSIFLIQ